MLIETYDVECVHIDTSGPVKGASKAQAELETRGSSWFFNGKRLQVRRLTVLHGWDALDGPAVVFGIPGEAFELIFPIRTTESSS